MAMWGGDCEEKKNVAARGECRLILARTRVNGVKISRVCAYRIVGLYRRSSPNEVIVSTGKV